MPIPNKVNPGERPSAATVNSIIDALHQLQLRDSPTVRVNTTTTGTTLKFVPQPTVNQSSGSPSVAPDRYLFPQLTTMPVPDPVPEGYTPIPAWTVTPGTINSYIPRTETGKLLQTADEKPSTDTRDWAVPIVGAGNIWAKASYTILEDKVLWQLEVIYSTAQVAHELNTPTSGHWRLGQIRNTAKPGAPAVYQVIPLNSSNLTVRAAGMGWDWGYVGIYYGDEGIIEL